MKEISIEEKQEIYEYLLSIDCPDLLAALIAERGNETLAWHLSCYDSDYPLELGSLIGGAFYWDESPEGDEFWRILVAEIEGDSSVYMPYVEEATAPKEELVIKTEASVEGMTDGFDKIKAHTQTLISEPLAPKTRYITEDLGIAKYKYHIGTFVAVIVGVIFGLRYTGVI